VGTGDLACSGEVVGCFDPRYDHPSFARLIGPPAHRAEVVSLPSLARVSAPPAGPVRW